MRTASEFSEQLNRLTSDPMSRIQHLEMQSNFIKRSFANPGHASAAIVDLLASVGDTSLAMLAGSRAI